MFFQSDVFDKVVKKCGDEIYQPKESFKVESEYFNFFIRLKPIYDGYNHLFIYEKLES